MKKEELMNGNLDNITLNKINDDYVKVIANRFLLDLKDKSSLKSYFYMGCEINALAASIAYISHIKANSPKSLDEISVMYSVERTGVGRCVRKMKLFLGTKYCETQSSMGTKCMILRKPADYIEELCNKLKLPEEVINKSKHMAKRVQSNEEFIGKNPAFIASGIIYVTCLDSRIINREVTQTEIAKIMGCSEVTVRKNSKIVKRIEYEKE
jgi:transcription initiation factor TFIIIB Brf1 subunit/transcription initiation factor TFIIB